MVGPVRKVRLQTYGIFFALIALDVFLTHAPFLHLPYYWDELGQFVPASLDLFHTGAWVPYTTVPNVHPPGVMAYLAVFWKLTAYSIAHTRIAMLLLASLGGLGAFLLAIELCQGAKGAPAFAALAMLCLSPLFVAQSMLAQLDMPAMVMMTFALLLFLQGRYLQSALVCTALVMVKETGIVAPALFGFWLLAERKVRDALWFVLPLLTLVLWLVLLRQATGHLFGSAEFTQYNAFYNVHPVRLTLALVRRFYYLFIGTFHWIGTVALIFAWRRTRLFRSRAWAVVAALTLAHILLVSILGGAVLERYLLPVLPLAYAAFALAFSAYTPRWRMVSQAVLLPALAAASVINPPYPFPMENNLAFATFVSLHARAASFCEARFPGATIATTFPLASAMRRPEFGYVAKPLRIREVADFSAANLAPLQNEKIDIIVIYPLMWDPLHLVDQPALAQFLHGYYGYEPQLTSGEAGRLLNFRKIAQWTQNGQSIEVLAAPSISSLYGSVHH